MQKFVSKYATAAHLALLAVAPLFLFPFLSAGKVAVVLLWLSLVAAVWVVMEPSRRRHEMPHEARMRVAKSVMRDPMFWFCLVVVVYAAIRAMNGGIAFFYDAEAMRWSIRPPKVPILPGSVDNTGLLPFSAIVALTVLLQGARHALGRSARLAFFAAASIFAGASATLHAFALSYENAAIVELARCGYRTATFAGTAYGIFLLGGVTGLFGCAEVKWRQAEPLVALGTICSAVGMIIFSPPAVIVVFAAAFLLYVILTFAVKGRYLEGSGSFRCALGILCVFLAAGAFVFMAEPSSPVGEKFAAFMSLEFFPAKFAESRETLSRIAFKVWKEGPWLGSGLGSFPLDIRFAATAADWKVIDPMQQAVPSGWWMLIAERGVIGAGLFAVGLGILLWSYCYRMIRSFGDFRWQPMNLLLPVLLPALTALAFVECSFMRADVLPALAAFLALSASSFPSRRKADKEK